MDSFSVEKYKLQADFYPWIYFYWKFKFYQHNMDPLENKFFHKTKTTQSSRLSHSRFAYHCSRFTHSTTRLRLSRSLTPSRPRHRRRRHPLTHIRTSSDPHSRVLCRAHIQVAIVSYPSAFGCYARAYFSSRISVSVIDLVDGMKL